MHSALDETKGSLTVKIRAKYPTTEHEKAAEAVVNFFAGLSGMVRSYCLNNLEHIPLYANRGLHFQAFQRLYNAFGEFLQVLFIARRTYPIAYDKWIQEQVEEILGMPELYRRLPKFFEIQSFESREISDKANELKRLLNDHT
jgi:hypothetical protein